MKIDFHKYEGAGNDFIIIDNRNSEFDISQKLISNLCNRKFGIGADGLILLYFHEKYDFEMKYFNTNGKEGTMCGNGGRCIVAFAKRIGIIKNKTDFLTIDGKHSGEIIENCNNTSIVKLLLNDVKNIKFHEGNYFINTGSPHYIKFVDDIINYNVISEGKKLRHKTNFDKNGTNVDFVEIKNKKLYVRTYERGVENETLSCGTGATASAIAASFRNSGNESFEIITKGGNLKVSFKNNKNNFSNIWLEGPATFVFKGKIDLIEDL
ncbi:MAG: diaminopimelate epimerase [Bacteroidales bacterium]|nr:diaminopimelate epimerase [Bacteroidales bacterium]